MKLIRRLLISVAALALAVGIGGWLLDHDVFRSQAILGAIHKSETCTQLASVLPPILAQRLGLPSGSEALLAVAVTPTVICDRLDQFLPQLEAYYRDDGPPPQLDLRDVATKLRAADITLPPDAQTILSHPIVYSNPQVDEPLKRLADSSGRFTGLAFLIAIIGMILVWLLAPRHRWASVGAIWLSAAVTLAIEGGLVRLLPSFVTSPLASSYLAPIATPVRRLAEVVTASTSHDLLLAAAITAGIGAALHVLGFILGLLSRRRPRAKSTETSSDGF